MKLSNEIIPVKGCHGLTSVNTRRCVLGVCAHRMPRPSASGIAGRLEVNLSCPSEERAQPEEKAPARECGGGRR